MSIQTSGAIQNPNHDALNIISFKNNNIFLFCNKKLLYPEFTKIQKSLDEHFYVKIYSFLNFVFR